eukprot:1124352_1
MYLVFLTIFARSIRSEILTGNTFTCTTNQEFSSDQLDCNNGADCTVNCGSFTECCQSTTINGPATSGSLTITASGTNGLKSSKIFCPPSPNQCSITVSGDHSDLLSNAEIYSKNGFNHLSLTCNHVSGVSNCYSASNPAQLHCQSDYGGVCSMSLVSGTTNWQCDTDGVDLCNDATPNGYYGSYHECNTDEDCTDQTHYCNDNEDCTIHCDHEAAGGRWSCRDGHMYGPTTGHMTVICHGAEACWAAGIYFGASTGDLTVSCRGRNACWWLRVYCPINGACSITASGSGQHVMRALQIFNVAALDDLSVSCEYATSRSENCYPDPPPSDDAEPILHCGGEYGGSCRFLLQSGYDVWDCATGTVCTPAPTRKPTVPTLYPTAATTLDPTSAPTNNPSTAPSSAPSNNPTPAPTFDPTGAPSRSPSSAPTANPTTAPSTNPTEYPSLNPSNNPTFSPTVAPSMSPSFAPSIRPSSSTKAPTINPSNHPTTRPSPSTKTPSVPPTVTPTLYPIAPNTVVTNYEILIAIKNCDDDEDGDHQGSRATCALDTDVIGYIVDSVQGMDDHVDVVSAGVVDDDLVIRISITTDPTKVLQSDVVRSHVEKEVRDNDDFGDVDVEVKDSQFNDLNKDKEDGMAGFIEYMFVDNIVAVIALVVVCFCGICVTYFFCQQRKTQKELMKMVQMSSVDPSENNGEENDAQEETNNKGEGAAAGDAGDDTFMQMPTVPLSMPFTVPSLPGEHEDVIDDNVDPDDAMYDNDDRTTSGHGTSTGGQEHVVGSTEFIVRGDTELVLCTPQNEFIVRNDTEPVLCTPQNEFIVRNDTEPVLCTPQNEFIVRNDTEPVLCTPQN